MLLVEVTVSRTCFEPYHFTVDLQEADTLKIFYGLDDIKGASDIIIVTSDSLIIPSLKK